MTETVNAWAIERMWPDGRTYITDVRTFGDGGAHDCSEDAYDSLKYRMMIETDKLVRVTIERAKP